MHSDDEEAPVVAQGIKAIICATTASGKQPAQDDLDALSEKDRVRIQALFDLLADTGLISNKEKFKKLDGTDLYEFRNREIRFLCFWDAAGRLALTHMFRKGGQKAPKRELKRANDIMAEHQARVRQVALGGGKT